MSDSPRATCPACHKPRPYSAFPDGHGLGACVYCRRDIETLNQPGGHLAAATNRRRRLDVRTAKYKLSADEFDGMAAAQDYACAICHTKPPNPELLHVDHCHTSGRVRGLLCSPCNTALGLFRDDPANLKAAADYLQAATSVQPS